MINKPCVKLAAHLVERFSRRFRIRRNDQELARSIDDEAGRRK